MLLGYMGLWAMNRFDVLPERAGVCVTLGAARDLTDIWFLQK